MCFLLAFFGLPATLITSRLYLKYKRTKYENIFPDVPPRRCGNGECAG